MIRQPDGSSKKCGGNHWASECPDLRDGTVGAVLMGCYDAPADLVSAAMSIDFGLMAVWFLRLVTCIALVAVVVSPSPVQPMHGGSVFAAETAEAR